MAHAATESAVEVHRLPLRIQSNPRRTILRFFWPGADRCGHVVDRVMRLPASEVRSELAHVLRRFASRHVDLESLLMQNAQEAASRLQIDLPPDRARQLLLGAATSMEYAIEAAALFN